MEGGLPCYLNGHCRKKMGSRYVSWFRLRTTGQSSWCFLFLYCILSGNQLVCGNNSRWLSLISIIQVKAYIVDGIKDIASQQLLQHGTRRLSFLAYQEGSPLMKHRRQFGLLIFLVIMLRWDMWLFSCDNLLKFTNCTWNDA